MLGRILLATLMTFSTLSFSDLAFASVEEDEHIMPASDDRWIPWPFHLAQPFPWQDIQGLWRVRQGDYISYFGLKVVRQKSTGIRQLQVKQYDGITCRVLASGVGIERGLKILAQMTSRGGVTYRVHLTAFSEKDSPIPPLRGNLPVEEVMVLSIGALEPNGPEEMVHMQIMKVSSGLNQRACMEDIRNAFF